MLLVSVYTFLKEFWIEEQVQVNGCVLVLEGLWCSALLKA